MMMTPSIRRRGGARSPGAAESLADRLHRGSAFGTGAELATIGYAYRFIPAQRYGRALMGLLDHRRTFRDEAMVAVKISASPREKNTSQTVSGSALDMSHAVIVSKAMMAASCFG